MTCAINNNQNKRCKKAYKKNAQISLNSKIDARLFKLIAVRAIMFPSLHNYLSETEGKNE